LPWILASAALASKVQARRQAARYFAGFAAAAVLIAAGRHFPLHHLFYHLPVFNGFRTWVRFLCQFSFALCVLAALGWEALREEGGRARRVALIAAGLLVLVAMIALANTSSMAASGAARLAAKTARRPRISPCSSSRS